MADSFLNNIYKKIIIDLGNNLQWSYLPPLMIYMAAGISGLTGIVGIFFIKEYLNLSASFLLSLSFWAGIPWILKIPLGHMVDLFWKQKYYFVFLGASLISFSLIIMYGVIEHSIFMLRFFSLEVWFIISTILAPTGYVIQDVVADAMTVESVPLINNKGQPFSKKYIKSMHTTMQTLGRFSIILGFILVASVNVTIFSNVESWSIDQKMSVYAQVYLYSICIPIISVIGVLTSLLQKYLNDKKLLKLGIVNKNPEIYKTKANYIILTGSLIFVFFTIFIGITNIPFSQEIVFLGSMIIILFLMFKLINKLQRKHKYSIIGTAIIIFIFRATPSVGPGLNWFEIDILKFDQQFFSVLSLLSSILTLVGIIILRPFIVSNSIAKIIVILTLANSVLMLPSIGMYYNFHIWTASLTQGIVDARFIAVINTSLESPLGQVAMIPLLSWIAKNAPNNLKATFFAVFASFTNLALSARDLFSKYLNDIFVITRKVTDKINNNIISEADYSDLGYLLITVLILALILPISSVYLTQRTKFKTNE